MGAIDDQFVQFSPATSFTMNFFLSAIMRSRVIKIINFYGFEPVANPTSMARVETCENLISCLATAERKIDFGSISDAKKATEIYGESADDNRTRK